MKVVYLGLVLMFVMASGCASEAEMRWRDANGMPTCGFKERMADSMAATGAGLNNQNVEAAIEASRARHPWCI